MYSLDTSALTDVGRQRKVNQDNYIIDNAHALYVVADGMGGHAGGEIASAIGVALLSQRIAERAEAPDHQDETPAERLQAVRAAITEANAAIYDKAQTQTELHDMGTTLALLHVHQHTALICHVGDSRVYRMRGRRLELLTRDHSLLNQQLQAGIITPDQAKNFPYKNVITRALGIAAKVKIDSRTETMAVGDMFFLCCDGLHGVVDGQDLANTLFDRRSSPLSLCRRLVNMANGGGGPDNITALIVHCSNRSRSLGQKLQDTWEGLFYRYNDGRPAQVPL